MDDDDSDPPRPSIAFRKRRSDLNTPQRLKKQKKTTSSSQITDDTSVLPTSETVGHSNEQLLSSRVQTRQSWKQPLPYESPEPEPVEVPNPFAQYKSTEDWRTFFDTKITRYERYLTCESKRTTEFNDLSNTHNLARQGDLFAIRHHIAKCAPEFVRLLQKVRHDEMERANTLEAVERRPKYLISGVEDATVSNLVYQIEIWVKRLANDIAELEEAKTYIESLADGDSDVEIDDRCDAQEADPDDDEVIPRSHKIEDEQEDEMEWD